LLKGGHSTGTNATDILYSQNAIQEFTLPKIETNGVNIRGTGCCLSTAIACYLRKQHTLQEAIMHAKQFIHQGITNATTVDNKTKILNWNNYELVNS
jgi:hydroxymethylpyrimidine/phosphomethylpyrimidine kinase